MPFITYADTAVLVDNLSLPVATPDGIRCGSCKERHSNVASVKLCFEMERYYRSEAESERAAELAIERHFEERGYWEAIAQDEYEARNGVVDFMDAWHMESPETCPCHN